MKTQSLKQQWQESGIGGKALMLVTMPLVYAQLWGLFAGMAVGAVIGAL